MKAIELLISGGARGVAPIDGALMNMGNVRLEDLLYVDAFDVTQGVFCYRLHGPPDAIRRAVDKESTVSAVSLGVIERGFHHLFLRRSFTDSGGILMQLSAKYPVLLDTPIAFTEEGDARVMVAAPKSALEDVYKEVLTDNDVSVSTIETYSPPEDGIRDSLTDRQQEILDRALERGYYNVPRSATQGDLARDFDIAPSTVQEHIRHIEAKVFNRLTG